MLPHGVVSMTKVTLFAHSPACGMFITNKFLLSSEWGHTWFCIRSASSGLQHSNRGKVGIPGSLDDPVSFKKPGFGIFRQQLPEGQEDI